MIKGKVDISIIIPIYYGKIYISNLMDMISKNKLSYQTEFEGQIEAVFVNDSPEEIISIDEEYCRVISNEKNMGIHQSRINGLKISRGEYVLFLDQDDYIADDYLLSQMRVIGDNDVVVCNGRYKKNQLIYQSRPEDIGYSFLNKVGSAIVSPGQAVIKKSAIPIEWLHNVVQISGADDYLLWLLMALKKSSFVYNPQSLYVHVETGENASHDWGRMANSDTEVRNILGRVVGGMMKAEDFTKIDCLLQKEISIYQRYENIERGLKELTECREAVESILKSNDCDNIVLYGYGEFGTKLHQKLKLIGIRVNGIIDSMRSEYIDENEVADDITRIKCTNSLIIITPIRHEQDIRRKIIDAGIDRIMVIDEFISKAVQY